MAKPRRGANVKLLGVVRRRRPALMVSTALCATVMMVVSLPAAAQLAGNAHPTGGVVTGGGVSIGQHVGATSSQTTVTQTTQRGAINWQTFNVGSNSQVDFQQPSSSSVTLNKVVGPDPSKIAGRIDANGQIIIENQSGVMFYKGSEVNTAGLMVTAAASGDAATRAFINGGQLALDQAARPGAMVVNQGQITVKQAGLAALVAPQVVNSGVITARLGTVVLAGGATRVTLDLYGDGMLSLDVTGQVVHGPNGAMALVTNSGLIVADGGTVQLTATAADGLVQSLVTAGGRIQANSVAGHAGTVTVDAVGGSVTVVGQLDAQGTAPGTTGGAIVVNATGNVTVASGARIDASGQAGGGVVAIGTTLQRAAGGPGVTATQTAASVTVQHGATIAANATKSGDGGRVAVLSTGTTRLNGTITAKGGAQAGHGGLVETSGDVLSLGSLLLVDTTAPNGATGSWLMDPIDVTIGNAGGDVTPGSVVSDLVSNNVTILADNDITVNNSINATTNNHATNNLVFQAGRSIDIAAGITLNGGNFVATANDSTDTGLNAANRGTGAGSFTMSPTAVIDTHVGNQGITITVGGSIANTTTGGDFVPGTITLATLATGNGGAVISGGTLLTLTGNITAGTGLVSLGSTGGISQTGGSITATDLALNAAGAVTVTQANAIGTLAANVAGSGNSLQFSDAATNLTIGNTGGVPGINTNGGGVSLATTTSGNVTVSQQIASRGGEIDIAVAPGGTFAASQQINSTGAANTNGNIVIVADAMNLNGAQFSAGPAATGATVVLTPATKTEVIALGTVSSAGTLGLQDTVLNNAIQAGMLQIGDPSVSGNINIVAATNLDSNRFGSLLLVAGASGGTVTQASGKALTYNNGTLGVIAAGAVTLTEPTNQVGVLAGLSSGGNFSYQDSNALTVGALPLQQRAVTVSGTTGLAISSAYTLSTQSGPLAGVTAAGSGAVFLTTKTQALTLNDPLNGGTVDLTLAAGVTQGAAGTIDAGTLQSSGGVTGTVTLTGTLNTIAALGSIAITNGNFSLTDTGSLSVAGPLTGGTNVALTAGTIGVVGSIGATGTLLLDAGAGGIGLNSGHVLSGNVVDLSASGGGVTQVATGGSIVAATLQSSSGVAGGASLASITNQVTTIGSFAVSSGNFSLKNSTPLTVGSTLSAGAGNVSLETSTGTISVGAAGTVMVPATTGVASFRAASMSVVSGGTITGGTFEYSLDTPGALTLGTGGELTTLAGIGSSTVRLGEVGGSITANSINIASAFGGSTTALELDSNGAISQTAGATLTATTLTGSAAVTTSGDADFSVSNAIGTLGNFVVGNAGAGSTGNFILFNAGSIAVPGSVSAATVTVDAGTIGLSGSLVTPNTGTIDLVSTVGGIALTGSAVLNTGTVNLASATSISEASTATIDAASFSAAASAGAIGLDGTANAIDVVTGLVASGGGVTLVVDPDLVLTGSISGDDLFFEVANSADILQIGSGAVGATLFATAASNPTITFVADTITEPGTGANTIVATNGVNSGTLAIAPWSGGTVVALGGTAAGAGTLLVDQTLLSAVTLGTAGLLRIGHYIGTDDVGTLSAGAIVLNGTAVNLGTVASTLELDSAGSISGAGSIALTVGTLTGTAGAGGVALLGTGNAVATLGTFGSGGSLFLNDGTALNVLGIVSAGSASTLGLTVAGSLAIGNSGTVGLLNAGTVSLTASGTISEDPNKGTIVATLLNGPTVSGSSAAAVNLVGTGNAVGTLGSFLTPGSFVLNDGTALAVLGTVTAGTAAALGLTSAGSLSIGNAGTAGLLNAGTVSLTASGTISEDPANGSIIATLLNGPTASGSSAAAVNLAGTGDAVGTLGSFLTPGSFVLNDGTALAVLGTVTAGTAAALGLTSAGSLSIGNAGTVGLLNAGTVALTAGGTISEDPTNGSIVAVLLKGPTAGGSSAAAVNLIGSGNTIGTLANFLATGSFALNDSTGLAVLGAVAAGGGTVLDLTLDGSLAIGNSGTAGVLNAGTGTVALLANGTITEDPANGTIIAAVLSGPTATASAAASVDLVGTANAIGTLDTFLTTGNFILVNSTPLTVAGVIDPSVAGSEVFIEEAAGKGLDFVNGGSIIVSNGTIGLVADALTAAASGVTLNAGTGGTIEIAPRSTVAVSLDGTNTFSGLLIGSLALAAMAAGELQIGSYHDATNAGAVVTSASSIDIGGATTLTVPRLRLDASGPVTESVGPLSVGTLVGTAPSYTLTNAANSIGTLGATGAGGTLTAVSGNILVLDAISLAVQNAVSAPGGNIFLQEATGQELSFLTGGSVIVSGGAIGLVADTLSIASSNVTISAGGPSAGTVEIAPATSGSIVSLAGSTGLELDGTALADVGAALLRIGGYHDQVNGGTNVVTAASIDIGGTVSLAASAVATLRLDANGPISESGGPLSVSTISASTNDATGDINLGAVGNSIAALGDMTALKGTLAVLDHTSGTPGTLTVPGASIVYGNSVSIVNFGSIVLAGSIGACGPSGSLGVTAFAGDILVSNSAVIGALGTATFAADNNFTQSGGLINASDVAIGAGGAVTQSGGVIAAVDTTLADIGVGISAGAAFSQSAGARITSNSGFSLTASSITVGGNIIGVGAGTLSTAGTLSQSGGTIAAGQSLSVLNTSGVTQTAGTISAGGLLTIDSSGALTESGSAALAGDSVITNVAAGPLPNYVGSLTVTVGGTTVYCVCSGAETIGNPGTFSTGSPPGSPTPGTPLKNPYFIEITEPTIPITHALTANWVELNGATGITESGGTIDADLLTGSGGNVLLTAANIIGHVGSFAATGNFILNDPATALAVIGTVSVGNGNTLMLTTPTLTVDHTGATYTVPSGTFPNTSNPNGGPVHNDTVTTAGLLYAPAGVSSNVVTPGQILLQTDDLILSAGSGSAAAANGVVVLAPDGFVAIAPKTTGSIISLDTTAASVTGTLSLSQLLLSAINTVGASTGTAGTETLVLGSLDGSTPVAGAININTGIALSGSGVNGIARNLVLDATGAVQETAGGTLSVISLAGSAGSGTGFALTNGNTIAEIGNVATRTVGGATYSTAGTPATGLLNLVSAGDVRVTGTGTLAVLGGVVANATTAFASGTIALTAPVIRIVAGPASFTNGAVTSAGSLLATAGVVAAGTLTPSVIALQADSLSIASTGTAAIVRAPSGQVAIAPLTPGRTISIDSTATLGGPTLSLGATDLTLIDTLSGPLSSLTPGPVGTQTLSLGSVNNGGSVTAGGISINTPLVLGGTANLAANTLALYSIGDVVETPASAFPTGSISVNTLTGTVSAGNIYLNGANTFSNLGNLASRGGTTTPGGVNANLLATSGNILIKDTQTLNVVTNVQAAGGASNYAEIDVLGATTNGLNVLNGGTVQAGSVYLRAGNGALAGAITVLAGGSVLALASTGEADLVAGLVYTPATPVTAPSNAYPYGNATAGGEVAVQGVVNAGATGTIGLFSGQNIDESGMLEAGLLRGFAQTGHASLTGNGSPSSNLIANLGSFTTETGFVLHDAEALAVVGSVTDFSANGVTIAVAPAGSTVGPFGIGDLALGALVTASSGTVKLEATGNVYETGSGTVSNTGGSFTVVGGSVTAMGLTSQAGVIPDTESGGNTAGTIPASNATFGRAIDWFGNVNSVGTLGAVTATGNFLLATGPGPGGANPTVSGTLTAGTLPTIVGTIAPAYSIVDGPFSTTPDSVPSPFAEIDVNGGGNLLVPGIVHVGLDGSVTGYVTLRAGNPTTTGSVTIGGDVYAANGGTVSVSAGFDPTMLPANAYDTGCSANCNITITGVIWGDQTGATPALASLVTLNAASSIDETLATAKIGATTLTGEAGGHVNLSETAFGTLAAGAAANQIGTLASFVSNAFTDDPQGFMLRDGRALVVTGPVADDGAAASHGISIAVVPGSGTVYTAGDLSLQGNITAATTSGAVVLQATGNIVQTSGTIGAGTLIAQAGAVPNTESTGTQPGTIPASPILSTASIVLNDANQVSNLGSAGLGVSAEGAVAFTNVPSLTVNGSIEAFNGGTVSIVNTGSVTNNSVIRSGFSDVTLSSQGSITNNVLISGESATITAGTSVANNGLIGVNVNAFVTAQGGDIDNDGGAEITAGNIATLTASGSINDAALAIITAQGAGSPTAPSVLLIAQGGSIFEASTGTISATAASGAIQATASSTSAGNITVQGIVDASGSGARINLNAGSALTQGGGTIIAGGPGTIVNGTLIPSVALVAQTGTIGQALAGTILATNNAGSIALTANASDIDVAGSIGATGTAGVIGLTAAGAINQTAGMIAAGSTGDTTTAGAPSVTLLAQTGTIAQSSGAAILANNTAGTIAVTATGQSIATSGNVIAGGAGGVVDVTAGTSISQLAGTILAGGVGTIAAAGTATPNLLLMANGGSIVQSAGALIAAPNASGVIKLDATGDIDFAGLILAPGATGGIALLSGGNITETAATGLLEAATLIGGAADGATLLSTAGTGNQVANLGSFNTGTVGVGNFVLVSGESLTVAAPVIADTGSVAITANNGSSLTNNATIYADTSATLLANASFNNTGSVIAHTGVASVTATNGTLFTSGLIDGGTGATLQAQGDLTNSGSVIALANDVSITSASGSITNNFANAFGNATLMAGTDLTNTLVQAGANALLSAGGTINNTSVLAGGNATLQAGQAIFNNGVSAGIGAILTAATLDISNTGSGVIAGSGPATLTATLGNITSSAQVTAGTTVNMTADQNLTNSGSVIAHGGTVSMTAQTGTLFNSSLIQASTSATLQAKSDLTNSGSVIALANDVSITSTSGSITNNFANAFGNATLTAGTDLTNTLVQAGANALLSAGGTITNTLVQAGTNALLSAGGTINNTSVLAGGNATLQAGQAIFNNGVSAGIGAILTAATLDISNTGSGVIAGSGPATLTATLGNITSSAQVTAGTTVNMTADQNLTNSGSVIAHGGTVSMTAQTGTLFNSSLIQASTSATLQAKSDLTNSGSVIALANDVSITSTSGSITNNFADAFGNATLTAGTDLTNTLVQAGANALLSAGGTINNTSVLAGGNATLQAGQAIFNNGVSAGIGAILTAATLDISNTGSGVIAGSGPATLTATLGNITSSAQVTAGTTVNMTADQNLTNSGSVIAHGGTVSMTAQTGTLFNSSLIQASTSATLQAKSDLTNSGSVIALANDVSITSTSGSITNNFANAFGNATLTAGTDLTNTLVQAGANALLSAGGTITNTLVQAGTNALLSAGGTINNTSVLAGGNATLQAGQAIFNNGVSAGIGAILTAATLDISNTGSGVIAGSGPATLTATLGNITSSAQVTAGTTVNMTADQNLTNSGSVIAHGGTVSMTAQTGTLFNSSLIQASTSATLQAKSDLTNSGSVIALANDVSITSTSGSITNNFANAFGNATLTAGTDLTNTLVQAGANALLSAGGTINNTSVLAGGNATLQAGQAIFNNGVSAGIGAILTAATLDISNTGSGVIAGSGPATLTATLGNITSSAQVTAGTTVTMTADQNLTNSGSVIAHGGTVSMTAQTGTLFNSSAITASTAATLSGAAGLTNTSTGSVIAQDGTAWLASSAGPLSNAGLIEASMAATLMGNTGLTNTGSIIAQGGTVWLISSAGPLSNSGLIEASTAATLMGEAGLTNTDTGSIIAQGGTAWLTSSAGTLSNGGLIKASMAATLMGDTGLTNTGSMIAQGGTAWLESSAGTLFNSGIIEASTGLTLLGEAGLTNTDTGSIIAQGGTAWLTSTAGTLSNSGLISASTGLTLLGDAGLSNTDDHTPNSGLIIAQGGTAWLTASAGPLSNSGLISASTAVTLMGDAGFTNSGSIIAQGGTAWLTSPAGTLSNSGLVSASTTATLTGDTGLTNTGSVIAQTGNATLTATTGTLLNTGLISAATTNAIVALAALDGPIISSGSSSVIATHGTVNLNAGTTILETGTLIAELLTGSASGSADFGVASPSPNQVANLGSFTAGNTLALYDGAPLSISGVVTAPTIDVYDGSNTITLNGGEFITGGAVRPTGTLQARQLPPLGITSQGAYLYAGSVLQSSSSFTVTNIPTPATPESILAITLQPGGGGAVQFSGGLNAPKTWLIVNVGAGTAGGQIDVEALDFGYTLPPGRADFTGLINTFSGAAAAGAANIQPQPNANFRVDGCPIHSVNCALLPTQGVPTTNPVNDINIGAPLNQQNPEDLVLPVVSDERYELVPCDDPNAPAGCPADTPSPKQPH